MVIVLIKFEIKIVIISSVYMPNKAAIEVINDIFYNYSNADFILLGDFNIPSAISTNTKELFFDNISFLNMYQFNNICNSKMISSTMFYQTIILLIFLANKSNISLFYSLLSNIINSFVPTYIKSNSSYPISFSNELKLLINQKKKTNFNFKYLKSYSNYIKFSNLRTKCKNLRHIDYFTH
ncbi:Uncharacterized protein FWK35_00013048 [Aphis craccivora]|uniref:Uncharacterized protein n=1 Tax=Aphis craccivora TaxID=307492 RepID=A0A6G0YIE8_APHCR|nr:Uncharacterized protein FWK35_00013048 [Aphis craccivora]